MTRLPDYDVLFRRTDDHLARQAGDDPLPAEVIAEFARTARAATEQYLTEHGTTAAAEAWQRRLASLRAEHAEKIDAGEQQQRRRLAEQIEELRRALADAQKLTAAARAERDAEARRADRLHCDLIVARRDLAAAHGGQQHRVPCTAHHRAATAPGEPRPWADLLDRIRVELAGWQGSRS